MLYKEKRLNEFVERKFPEWRDDKSMIFYMTNFKRTRQVNVNDWETRLKFWRNVLLSIISEFYKNSILIITMGQLKAYMSRRKRSDDSIVETTLGWQTVVVSDFRNLTIYIRISFKIVATNDS